jgi:hypothetical protein
VVAHFDTLNSVLEDSVTLALGNLPQTWDFRSVGWDLAVDSVGDQQLWPEGGAGPTTPLATTVWNPAAGDSAVFELDSAAVATMADTVGAERGFRLDALSEGVRLELVRMSYSLNAKPSVNPDTLVSLGLTAKARTFIYTPVPDAPVDGIQVGGVPAWRSVFTMNMPKSVAGTPEICAQIECPLELTPEGLISASLVLTTTAPPPAFQPVDSLFMDARPVLEPERLPKSPLGSSLAGIVGVQLIPEDFTGEAGAEVEIPLGAYIENLISAADNPDLDPPKTVALLSSFEPLSTYFVSFEGPGSPNGPELRLIVTLSGVVEIR